MQKCSRSIQEPALAPKFVLELRVADGVVELGSFRRTKLDEASAEECAALLQLDQLYVKSTELDRARSVGSFVAKLRAATSDFTKPARVQGVLNHHVCQYGTTGSSSRGHRLRFA
jgi:hypothetical protein